MDIDSLLEDELLDYECDETDLFDNPEDLSVRDELGLDKDNFLRVKIEPSLKNFSRIKIEPALNNLSCTKIEPKLKNTSPKVILERIALQILPPKRAIKLKTEKLYQQPDVRLNPTHLQEVRVVLTRINDENLQSRAKLISSIKQEMSESISKNLRSTEKARTVDYIHLYCCQCKSLKAKSKGWTKLQHCEICGNQLIYLCMKCNSKNYVGYYSLLRHLKNCRGSGESKPSNLDSVVLHRCTVCSFTTTFSQILASHIKKKRHGNQSEIDSRNISSPTVNCEREKKNIKLEKKETKREDSLKIPRSKFKQIIVKQDENDLLEIPRSLYAKFIVKQDGNEVADCTERFCITCEKTYTSKIKVPKKSCSACNTQLHWRCKKCHWKSRLHRGITSHLRRKCYPCSYRCTNCNYTNSTQSLMQQHVMVEHDHPKCSKPESSLRNHGKIFYCDLCNFQSKWKKNLGRHRNTVHKT